MPTIPKQMFATFVLTTVGKGIIDSIDPTEALVSVDSKITNHTLFLLYFTNY